MLANTDVVTLRTAFGLFLLFTSLLALHLDDRLHISVVYRDRVTPFTSSQNHDEQRCLGAGSGFELIVWNWNLRVAEATR